MPKRDFTLSVDVLDKMKIIKDSLDKSLSKNVSWEEVFEEILKIYEKNQGPLIKISTDSEPKHTTSSELPHADADLGIISPPKKKPLKIHAESEKLVELTKKETSDTKFILVECNICGARPISMPVPKQLVLNATEPVVDISYCHGDPKHVIVAQLDHDFQVRRQRTSWIVFEDDYKK